MSTHDKRDPRHKVIVGTTVLYPHVIRQCLTKTHYFLTYDLDTESLALHVNHGDGGKVLFMIRNASHENAVKLAAGLGLKSSDGSDDTAFLWEKWNPVLRLYHDGSEDAETLRMEVLKLGVPCIIYWDSNPLGLSDGQGLHQQPMWSVAQMLQSIRETAERYKEQLATTP